MVATTTDPALGAIRLAWWRERLEALDHGAIPAEPRLSAIARQLLGRRIGGQDLSRLEDGWLPLLETFPWGGAQAEGMRLRGRILFGVGAQLLGGGPKQAEAAGELWSLVDAARHCSDSDSRAVLLSEAGKVLRELPKRTERKLRPLTVVAALAAHDVLGGSAAGRVAAALAHRLRGTFRGS